MTAHGAAARALATVLVGVAAACVSPDRGAEGVVVEPRLFTGARLVLGTGAVIEVGAMLVEGGIISAVGEAGTIPAPEGAAVVDLTGRTLIPALVDTHAHLGWEAYSGWGSEHFTADNLVDHLYRHAYYGVGTIISTGSDREDIASEVLTRQRIGRIGGARYHRSPGVGTPGGGPNPRFTDDPGWWGLNGVSSRAEAREAVRSVAASGARILKIWVDGRDARRGARVKLAPEIYEAVLDEARVRDVTVIAHATTLEDHKRLVRAGNRRFIHMPYDLEVDEEYLTLAREHNVYIVPTLGMVTKSEPYYVPAFEDPFFHDQAPGAVLEALRADYARPAPPTSRSPAAIERSRRIESNFRALRDHIILGTDAGAVGDFFGYADHVELALFVRMGMSPGEAIVAATQRSAQAFGLADVGRLEAGMNADFVVLEANPLEEIAHTRRIVDVYLRGDAIDRAALRELWTR